MRRLARCLFALAAIVSPAAPAAAASRPAAPPEFVDRTLANGLEVTIVADTSLPIVATRVWYHVGAANESPSTRGFAHLFEHLMFSGTATHPKGAWEAHHHRFGGAENAHTSWDETTYESDIPPEGFLPVLAMEADRMVNLRLDAKALDNEKRIVTEELRATIENDPMSRLLEAALKALCGDHPYAVTPLGTKEDIAAATLEQARAFYARYYGPKNAHLVIVGPVDGPATLAEVERHFGPLPARGERPPEVPALASLAFPERIRLHEDLPPAEIAALVYPLPPQDSEDDAALGVMEEILTGAEVDPFREDLVRRRHQALEAGSQVLMLRRGGVLVFYSAVLPYRREEGQFAVMDESMRRLERAEWLTAERLEGAKRKILRGIDGMRYRAADMADALAHDGWWRGDAALAFTRAERVAAVSKADVARVFQRYVAGARPVRVYVQPEKVPVLIRLFGWLAPLVMR
ncbi:MAG TPA: pitrilysin family protein [Candidatus Eisenbacteria bacterium]|jgi:zinc protease